jgi:hypothetical protein
VGAGFKEWFKGEISVQGFLYFRGRMGGVEVEVVELLSVWTQGMEPSLRWKHEWGDGKGLCTASFPPGGSSEP